MKPLDGRTVLLTGATGTLGRSIADAYARAGARLLLSARHDAPLQGLAGELSARYSTEVAVHPCDLSDAADIRRLPDEARRLFDRLDVLVNAAAVLGPVGPLWEVDWAEWTRAIDINLCAPARLCQLCVRSMPRSAGRGKIINVAGGGATSPRPRFSAYAAAKAALVRFSETLAHEVADRSVDVNCIAPGVLRSRMSQAVLDAGPERAGPEEHGKAERVLKEAADGRLRAAELCAFLASDASDGITGKLISAIWDPWESFGEHRADLGATDVYTIRRILPEDRALSWRGL